MCTQNSTLPTKCEHWDQSGPDHFKPSPGLKFPTDIGRVLGLTQTIATPPILTVVMTDCQGRLETPPNLASLVQGKVFGLDAPNAQHLHII